MTDRQVHINIQEVKQPDLDSQLVAERSLCNSCAA